MPGTHYGYPNGRALDLHPDGSVTMTESDGTTISVARDGEVVIRKPGHRPRVIRGRVQDNGRKIRFTFRGREWTVTLRENEVEFEQRWLDGTTPHKVEEKFDRDDGDRRERPDGQDNWSDPEAPTSTNEIPEDPVYDTASSSGGKPAQLVAARERRRPRTNSRV